MIIILTTMLRTLKIFQNKMLTKLSLGVVLFAAVTNVMAFEQNEDKVTLSVAFAALGEYQIDTAPVQAVSRILGHSLLASVSEKSGSNFSMFLPFGVQQINYIVANGSYIEENQAVAYLNGFDVHHFLDEYEAARELFLNAQQQYKSSKILFTQKALKQSQWLEISQNYFAAQLRFEHLNHYKAFLNIDSNENIAIKSPISGYVRFSSDVAAKQEGELLFDIIPKNSIRLKVSVPINNIANLASINVLGSKCRLAIASKEGIVKNFSQTTWSSSLNKECRFTLGEQLLVTPEYKQQAFVLAKKAIFELDNQNYIAIKNDDSSLFELAAIEILSSADNNYHVSSAIDLTSKQVLITSISALQGILLELGGE